MKLASILRRKNPLVLAITALTLVVALGVGYEIAATRSPWIFEWTKVKQADKVIAAVNSFQNRTGRLPNTLADVGLEDSESAPVHYNKTSDSSYIVWFGTVLGESATYESATKQRH